jgi:uncharacterized membrane protein YgaE (UPF0421/DUF939 family)
MDLEKLISVVEDVENKPNKDLFDAQNILIEEFDKTKQLILDLTKHLESVETLYDKVNNEIGKRIKKI